MKKLKKNLKEDLKFAAYAYLFPEVDKSRSQRRSLQIIDGAIEVFARHGVENTTDQMIAEISGVSRPLIFS